MGNRQWRVRKPLGNPRLIALPDDGALSHDQRDPDYDGYTRPGAAAEPLPMGLPEVVVTASERRDCPACGRKIRYNLARGYYYSHTLPEKTKTCPQSGRP